MYSSLPYYVQAQEHLRMLITWPELFKRLQKLLMQTTLKSPVEQNIVKYTMHIDWQLFKCIYCVHQHGISGKEFLSCREWWKCGDLFILCIYTPSAMLAALFIKLALNLTSKQSIHNLFDSSVSTWYEQFFPGKL